MYAVSKRFTFQIKDANNFTLNDNKKHIGCKRCLNKKEFFGPAINICSDHVLNSKVLFRIELKIMNIYPIFFYIDDIQ